MMQTRGLPNRIRNIVSTLALLLATTLPLQAHGGGALKVTPAKPGVGSNITISGTGFDKSATLKLELRGTLETLALMQVRSDGKGNFSTVVALPAEARAGIYSLVAIAPDGDVAARSNLSIVATSGGGDAHQSMGHTPEEMAKPHGAAKMKLNVPKSTAQTAAILLFLAVHLVAGVWLLRGTRRSEV